MLLRVKDISLPKTICLSILLEPNAVTTPGVSNDDFIIGDILELPSTNGEKNPEVFSASSTDKLQVLHDMKVTLEIERAEFKRTLKEEMLGSISSMAIERSASAVLKEQIIDNVMSDVVDLLPTSAGIVRTIDGDLAGLDLAKNTIKKEGTVPTARWKVKRNDCPRVVERGTQRLPPQAPVVEDPNIDMDTVGNISQGSCSLRIYCYPKPTPFVWNAGANKFLLPLPEIA